MTVEDPRPMLPTGQVTDPEADDRWYAAPYRCPCGIATDDVGELDRHLDVTEGAEPEHFEVLAGWTLEHVRQWQAAAVSSGGARLVVRATGRHRQDGCVATGQDRRPALTLGAGTVPPDRSGATVAGPLLTARSGLFDREGRPLVVRLEVPVSAEEMVVALYGEHERLTQADLGTDQDVWRYVAVVVAQDGMHAIEQLADAIAEQERCRTLAAPEWLARCRRRVAEVTAAAAGNTSVSASRVR
jgi:hypothetical protein